MIYKNGERLINPDDDPKYIDFPILREKKKNNKQLEMIK